MDSLAALSGLGYSRPLVAEALKQVGLLLPLWSCQCMRASSGIAQCLTRHQHRCKALLLGLPIPASYLCVYPVCTSQQACSVQQQDAGANSSRTHDAAPVVAHEAEQWPCRLTMTCKGRWTC